VLDEYESIVKINSIDCINITIKVIDRKSIAWLGMKIVMGYWILNNRLGR